MAQRSRYLVIALPILVFIGVLWFTAQGVTPHAGQTAHAIGGGTAPPTTTGSAGTPIVNTPATLPTPSAASGAQNTILNSTGGGSSTGTGSPGNNGSDTGGGHGSPPDPSSPSPPVTPTPAPPVVITPPPYVPPPPIHYPPSPASPSSPSSPASPSSPPSHH